MTNSAIQLQPGEDGARGAPSGRNRIINGQFLLWQRQTSLAAPVGPFVGSIGFAADRWRWETDTDGGTFNPAELGMARGDWADPGDPKSFGIDRDPLHFMRFEATLSGSSGSAANQCVQRIERVDWLNDDQATLSFWARTEVGTGTIAISLQQFFGSGGSSPVTLPASVNVDLTTTWTYYTIIFDIPSILGKTIAGGNDSLRVRFHNYIDATIATLFGFVSPINFPSPGILNLTNIQLEFGSEASSYENRSNSDELILCQRYYQKTSNQSVDPPLTTFSGNLGIGRSGSGGITAYSSVGFPVVMRVPPTATIETIISAGGGLEVVTPTDNGITIVKTTSNDTLHIWSWTADAEL